MTEIGEQLVAAWYQYIAGMTLVVESVRLEEQGELDVLAVDGTRVIGAEVATHVLDLNYGGYERTAVRVEAKVQRAHAFLERAFPTLERSVTFWAPRVPPGLASRLAAIPRVEPVVNDEYTRRVQELVDHARRNTAQTSNDAFRLLQVLTHVRGGLTLSP